MNINNLAQSIYQQNKSVGWWDGKQCVFSKFQLVSTEIAEATEGERKDLMDDHLPGRKMAEVELADALIRLLDVGAHLGWTYQVELACSHPFVSGSASVGRQHLGLNMQLCRLVDAYENGSSTNRVNFAYTVLVGSIFKCGKLSGYDILSAAEEKIIYNAIRSDHKRANRATEHGKKF